MREAVDRLKRYARKRIADDEEDLLTDYVGDILHKRGDAVFNDLLAPEHCSFGFRTPYFADFNERQRLALNHWAHRMQYRKITDGEKFLLVVNGLIVDLIEPGAPEIAELLRRESDEERDHIAAFTLLGQNTERFYGYDHVRFPTKPLRHVFVSRPFCRWLTGYFGSDFMVAFFLGRGIANHLGKGFELAVASTGTSSNQALHHLTHLHSLHENHHTGVSTLLSSCAHDVACQEEKRGVIRDIMVELMHRAVVWSTFAHKPTRTNQTQLSYLALRAMPAFRDRDDAFLQELVRSHFAAESGVEAVQNAHIPKLNARLVRNAQMRPDLKRKWVSNMRRDPGNQTWFPSGWEVEQA